MRFLAESVVQLTAQRNRAALESAALALVGRYVPAATLELIRCVGEESDLRLLTAARVTPDGAHSVPTPRVAMDALPALGTVPRFEQALRHGVPFHDASTGRHVFPVTGDSGCFAVVDLEPVAPLTVAQVSLVQSLLGVYRNQIGLLDYSETDSLTGLLNRKTFDTRFFGLARVEAAAVQRAPDEVERRSTALENWIGVIDLDHFKRVNDTYGHLIGDELLLLVARLMRKSFRYGDELFRFGGEEFVVLLRAPDREHARCAFERFRENLAAQSFPRVGKVTASVGFTMIGENDSPSDAFGRADRAVYFAKQNGRNQVRCIEDLLAGGHLREADHVGEVELF